MRKAAEKRAGADIYTEDLSVPAGEALAWERRRQASGASACPSQASQTHEEARLPLQL